MWTAFPGYTYFPKESYAVTSLRDGTLEAQAMFAFPTFTNQFCSVVSSLQVIFHVLRRDTIIRGL